MTGIHKAIVLFLRSGGMPSGPVLHGFLGSGSLVITSNLPGANWTAGCGNRRLTSALIYRLIQHYHILEFAGESFRFRQSLQRQASL